MASVSRHPDIPTKLKHRQNQRVEGARLGADVRPYRRRPDGANMPICWDANPEKCHRQAHLTDGGEIVVVLCVCGGAWKVLLSFSVPVQQNHPTNRNETRIPPRAAGASDKSDRQEDTDLDYASFLSLAMTICQLSRAGEIGNGKAGCM